MTCFTRSYIFCFSSQSLAINAGLSAVERDFSVMYPSSLFTKPILCVQDFVQSIHTYSSKVDDLCSPLTVFPAFMDRDFLYPALLIKVSCLGYCKIIQYKYF